MGKIFDEEKFCLNNTFEKRCIDCKCKQIAKQSQNANQNEMMADFRKKGRKKARKEARKKGRKQASNQARKEGSNQASKEGRKEGTRPKVTSSPKIAYSQTSKVTHANRHLFHIQLFVIGVFFCLRRVGHGHLVSVLSTTTTTTISLCKAAEAIHMSEQEYMLDSIMQSR